MTASLKAFEAGHERAIFSAIDPRYADGLGGRKRLIEDLLHLKRTYPRRVVSMRSLETMQSSLSRAKAEVSVDLALELTGARPLVNAEGPMTVELVRDGVFRVRSGLLTEVRDALRLLFERRAALERNDADAFEALLHPSYGEGDLDRARLLARLEEDLAGRVVRIEPLVYRIELRANLVHVDEHYRMTVDDQPLRPSIARLTLKRSAGKLRIQAGLGSPSSSPD